MTAPPQEEPTAAAHSESRKVKTPQGTSDTVKAVQRREEFSAHCTASIGLRTHQEHQINNRARTPHGLCCPCRSYLFTHEEVRSRVQGKALHPSLLVPCADALSLVRTPHALLRPTSLLSYPSRTALLFAMALGMDKGIDILKAHVRKQS